MALAAVAGACGGDDPGDLAAFCDAVADRDRFAAVFEDLDPTDVDRARATFERARTEHRALRDLAPAAARSDIDVLISFEDDLLAGLGPDGPIDGEGRPRVYQSLQPRFDEVEAAGDRLRVYVESNCPAG